MDEQPSEQIVKKSSGRMNIFQTDEKLVLHHKVEIVFLRKLKTYAVSVPGFTQPET